MRGVSPLRSLSLLRLMNERCEPVEVSEPVEVNEGCEPVEVDEVNEGCEPVEVSKPVEVDE